MATIKDILKKKKENKKIYALTSYDYWTTLILNEVGVDVILIGDSLGMVMLGYQNTLPVTMDEMIHHTKAVVRANKGALVVGDMPFMSDNICISETIKNAGRFIKEGGADAVKIEGGAQVGNIVSELITSGIPVMGHIGLTPQDILVLGGYRRQKDRERLIKDAKALQEAGAFSLVLECIPEDIAKEITKMLNIPTIGIGSGDYCDGKIAVTHDILGLCPELTPKFIKPQINLKSKIIDSIKKWKR